MRNSQNSLTSYLGCYVLSIFQDVKKTYTRTREWDRDKTRLLHELGAHGTSVMTIMLPAVGKSLDQALDRGQYNPSKAYLGKPRKGEKVPAFLRDLFIQVFDPVDGKLRSEPSILAICDLRQLLLGGKKILLPCSLRRTRNEVRDFIKTESGNRRFTLDWGSDAPLSSDPRFHEGYGWIQLLDLNLHHSLREHSQISLFGDDGPVGYVATDRELSLAQSVFDWVASDLGNLAEIRENEVPKHGRGAVSDIRRGVSKYQFGDWPSKLESIFPYNRFAVHDFMCSENVEPVRPGRNREVPSRLISVPKTQKSPRLIASEPSQYQWIQQLLMRQLEGRIRGTDLENSIDFHNQGYNQQAALHGSNGGDLVTIDLSSASDRLTCYVVERFARSNKSLLDALHACRTRWVRNSVDPNEWQFLQLKKYSTMGSAVIFPLQTIIYACLGIAATIITDGRNGDLWELRVEDASHRVRVFGDDIVIPRSAYGCMERLLVALGLKVNHDKTFTGENFRESCGVDAFRGTNVSPVYLHKLPYVASVNDVPSNTEISNNFWKRGYWYTALMLDAMAEQWDHLIPVIGPHVNTLGRFSFTGSSVEHLKERWNAKLHTREVRAFNLHEKTRRTSGTGRQNLMQWFTEEPLPDLRWEAGTDSVTVVSLRPGWQNIDKFLLKKQVS